jgi:hypothetical protein
VTEGASCCRPGALVFAVLVFLGSPVTVRASLEEVLELYLRPVKRESWWWWKTSRVKGRDSS